MSSFPVSVQQQMLERNVNNTVLSATSVTIYGVKYTADMVVSVGSCVGLPDFRQIQQVGCGFQCFFHL